MYFIYISNQNERVFHCGFFRLHFQSMFTDARQQYDLILASRNLMGRCNIAPYFMAHNENDST